MERVPPSPSTGCWERAGVWKETGNEQPALNPNSKQLFAAGNGDWL